MDKRNKIHAADIALFAGTLLISTIVGVYFAWKDRGKKSTKEYYLGGGKISPIPVAASISVSFVSAIAVLGQPVEVYLYGTVFTWFLVTQVSSTVIASTYFVPVYYRLQLTSVFEFLELRFNVIVRKLCSLLLMINRVLYLSIVIYTPSLALSAVTPLKLELAIALTSVVCTFYTTLGGMKGVIWTDLIQGSVMVIGMLAVLVRGIFAVGGIGAVFSAIERGERNNFFTFELDPRTRSTVWSIVVGIGVISCSETCCTQEYAQRYLCCRNVKMAKIALYLALIPGVLFTLLTIGNGMVMYAYYEGCDPLQNGEIVKFDQSLPSMAVEIFQSMPGMGGLFISTTYCGTLSSVSSGINAMAALVLTDFVIPKFPTLSPTKKMTISKALSVSFGVISMLMAYWIASMSSNVIQIIYTVTAFVMGPMVGIFMMGIFMPWINSTGALVGIFTGFAVILWIGASAMFSTMELHPKVTRTLQLSIENCTSVIDQGDLLNVNSTTVPTTAELTTYQYTTANVSLPEESSVIHQTLYSISPFYHGLLGALMCIIAGHLASFITGFNKSEEADPKLFMPIFNAKFFRFGVPEVKDEGKKYGNDDLASGAEKDNFIPETEF